MNMKKKVISIIFLAGLSAMTVSVQAQIPQEQLEEVLGEWYCPRMGYLIDIEPGTDEYVVMSVQDLESDREHTQKNDTPEYENMYYLYYSDETDEENEWNLWKCINSGPEVEIRDNEMNIMIPDNEERDYYQEETLFALKYSEEKMAASMPEKDELSGNWISEKTGKKYNLLVQPISNMNDEVDYLVMGFDENENGENMVSECHIVVFDGEKLNPLVQSDEKQYYVLSESGNLECYDKEDHVTDTWKRDVN